MANRKNIKSADEVIQMIAEVLAESDGKTIQDIANQVLTEHVTYLEDSEFEVIPLDEQYR